jgi:hypothetical protein
VLSGRKTKKRFYLETIYSEVILQIIMINNAQNIFENLENEIFKTVFDDGEESWFKILDCSHNSLNRTILADRVASRFGKQIEDHGIQFQIDEVRRIVDRKDQVLFDKKS